MKIVLYIKENETGEIRTIVKNFSGYTEEELIFQFEKDDFSCDCNRRDFFIGEYVKEHSCSDGKYSVNLGDFFTGKIIYKEF